MAAAVYRTKGKWGNQNFPLKIPKSSQRQKPEIALTSKSKKIKRTKLRENTKDKLMSKTFQSQRNKKFETAKPKEINLTSFTEKATETKLEVNFK